MPGFLKGDLIYFPHEGPAEAALAIEDRVAWVRGQGAIQLVLAGEGGKGDSMHQWLRSTNVVRARPHVCYNHLRCRRRLEATLGGRTVDFDEPLPELATLQALLSGLETELVENCTTLSKTAQEAERIAQTESSDIAAVRSVLPHQPVGPSSGEAEQAPLTHAGVWPTELPS